MNLYGTGIYIMCDDFTDGTTVVLVDGKNTEYCLKDENINDIE